MTIQLAVKNSPTSNEISGRSLLTSGVHPCQGGRWKVKQTYQLELRVVFLQDTLKPSPQPKPTCLRHAVSITKRHHYLVAEGQACHFAYDARLGLGTQAMYDLA